ncbi:MAG: ABC transporter ATP-binding protein [Clostridiales Family XIII bacterium]|nr:ABC transporter ATP-binding protein [Clostridia bacterium]MDE8732923.1 ABC transporter ATP-binding protein [Eubacteriales bacterium DFI.9.88]MDY3012024.1 ABC transporter ATP-binding protein [Clostridiales Family XIII bacterium]
MDLLTVKHLKKVYRQSSRSAGTEALKGVSFQVEAGEFVAIMGPSGCGKTTLLNVIAGIDYADEGQILLAGKDITAAGKEELAMLRRRLIYEISGGQQQRAAICRALIQNPSLLLADEPTGNLDSAAAANIMDCFLQLNQEQKRTILMVTHDASAASFCGRVVFLKDGKVIKEIKKEAENDEFYQQILGELSAFRRLGA